MSLMEVFFTQTQTARAPASNKAAIPRIDRPTLFRAMSSSSEFTDFPHLCLASPLLLLVNDRPAMTFSAAPLALGGAGAGAISKKPQPTEQHLPSLPSHGVLESSRDSDM